MRRTLISLGQVRLPDHCLAEVIVVDNASTDSTAAMMRDARPENMQGIYLFEPQKGKSNALNSALAMAHGEILIFTDDDVIPSEDWISQILTCFEQTQCDALVGKITLAPHLERPWMGKLEKYYLAVTDFDSGSRTHWIGANAAVHRRCLRHVHKFDSELGAGALGNAEDTLFGYQLQEAGFKIEYAQRAVVAHHPDESRFTRGGWLNSARTRARSNAYLRHHWEHAEIKGAALKWMWLLMKLKARSLLQPLPPLSAEGCPRWEWSHVHDLTFYKHYCAERRRPRNYTKRGLVKLNTAGPSPAVDITRTGETSHQAIFRI